MHALNVSLFLTKPIPLLEPQAGLISLSLFFSHTIASSLCKRNVKRGQLTVHLELTNTLALVFSVLLDRTGKQIK